jgi:hypothetical protein
MEWHHVLSIILGQAAIYLPIFFWMRTESNEDRRDIMKILIEMKDEMKDFHGRLERMDAEFKAYMMNEERKK